MEGETIRLLILTLQISPYHDARYDAATAEFEEVHVVSTLNVGDFSEFIAESFGNYFLHKLFHGQNEYLTAVTSGSLATQVQNTIKAIDPDVVAVAGWAAPESIAAMHHCRRHRIPTIIMSESQEDDAKRSLLRESVKRRLVSQFNAALVGGPTHAQYINKLGIPCERIHYGYNAVDNEHFAMGAASALQDPHNVRLQHNLPKRYILASARFIQKKNIPSLISAYASARKLNPTAPDLVVLGDGPERKVIEATIARERVGKYVHLQGFVSYDRLPAFYGLSEGFVHVSLIEQWGLVINEALAAGVPVIASNTCGAARTVIQDGQSGILTDISTDAITKSLVQFFRMPSQERSAMARAGANAINAWGPQRFGCGMKAAAESAFAAPMRGPIAPWDRILVKHFQRRVLNDVA
ncbi:glycosyltransferase family 4 protein [Hyphomonas sp. CY54-11-8]|uniref:glycosyltransferase family 4 protein n=1 Tax=Hyphomonas sp. CY54-11-8 TaxID=1280944 RepID=UPI000458D326|nr:glycosyltransferase family 4 protein [Hyphomonas sp. CY54-11-8]KCZ47176.1 hypothetical protein HY17_19415 [Hyphomonas sp. CY54-11-8]